LKKKISALLISLILLTPSLALSKSATYEKEVEKKIKCPTDFLQNPPLYFYCIYRDYHNHKYDEGIEKAKKALREIEPLLKKNPKAVIPNAQQKNAKLRDPHVYKVASDLHLLLGMLYYKKSLNMDDSEVKKVYKPLFEKLRKRGFDFVQVNELMALYSMKKLFPEQMSQQKLSRYNELLKKMGISEEELDKVITKARKISEKLDEERLNYLRMAFEEFQKAVKIDPENALAYYQLGNLYSGALAESMPETSEAAEEAYYKAALLLKKKGDTKGYKEVVKKLKMLNPNSKFLKMLEKGKNNA